MKTWIALFILVTLYFNLARAKEVRFECPPEIQTTQSIKTVAPSGWTAIQSPQVHHGLENITVYDGPPGEMASLVPDNEGREKETSFWTFAKKKVRPIWLACSYWKTDLQYARALPLDTSHCQVMETKARPPTILGLICR